MELRAFAPVSNNFPAEGVPQMAEEKKTEGLALTRENVDSVIGMVRPQLQADGGDVQIVDVSADGVVKLRLTGACGSCPMSTMTLRMGIERVLRQKIPTIKQVVPVV
jgi:Fe-S cluster biogenesis protein NfuA